MKSAASAMKFERSGETRTAKKALKKLGNNTTDITQMSTLSILKHLYNRHTTAVWFVIASLSMAWGIGQSL